ncbi:putative mitochondrial carrier protein [Trypanosoma rangeli]|uniref:Putative mitochondrial carrier protein n=1 Tax=Trypanosoma rangeli TaxID=5698 RepID=A0A422N706_TRYRA|nr:putative mitochondrial carrier protein [Trypanosoma rangeli]RNF01240.1 putative mitochondrial carrier protein [Trypanosoma rangeli]|eukprot:RNF01240.1 putative mitochondrial carrier protein [Trypanosoma rangeli]
MPPAQTHPTVTLGGPRSGGSSGFLHNLVFGPGGAAILAGSCEIVIFHPFDTTAKRLMAHHHTVFDPTSLLRTWQNFLRVVFEGVDKYKPSGARITFFDRVRHMYPGSTYAVAYKVMQRFIKFAGQPYMRDFLEYKYGHFFLSDAQQQPRLNATHHKKKHGLMLLEATAGCFVGVCEVVLLPIDRMKVLNQTNKDAIKNRSFFTILRQEGIVKMYAGIGTTAVRNAPGSFLLFGGAAWTKDYVFHLENYGDATLMQNFVSSTVGSCLGVWFTSPMDVVKTRIQNKRFGEGRVTGWSVVRETLQQEGFMAFYKGISPKLITTAPRLVFSYTMTQFFIKRFRGEKPKSSSA